MKKTLLLCFIHGFKGDDDTFADFPQYLRDLLQHSLPQVSVKVVVYPKYETRGDLHSCVARFKEWLQNQVIDLEISNESPSPMIDPSVRVVLVGHSMGGIVAAETVLSIMNDEPISTAGIKDHDNGADGPGFMFPSVAAVLAFDTPYLGVSPGVFAHGVEGQWNNTSAALTAATSVASALGYGAGVSSAGAPQAQSGTEASSKLLKEAEGLEAKQEAGTPAAAASSGRNWTNIAMIAGAVGVLGGGGAAAYVKRNELAASMTWVTSHLEFVSCLTKAAELRQRMQRLDKLLQDRTIGFANTYTALGKAVSSNQNKTNYASKALGDDRTFCVLPTTDLKNYFHRATNDKATSEISAHVNMFTPKEHPFYYTMSSSARDRVVDWIAESQWYKTAERDTASEGDAQEGFQEVLESREDPQTYPMPSEALD